MVAVILTVQPGEGRGLEMGVGQPRIVLAEVDGLGDLRIHLVPVLPDLAAQQPQKLEAPLPQQRGQPDQLVRPLLRDQELNASRASRIARSTWSLPQLGTDPMSRPERAGEVDSMRRGVSIGDPPSRRGSTHPKFDATAWMAARAEVKLRESEKSRMDSLENGAMTCASLQGPASSWDTETGRLDPKAPSDRRGFGARGSSPWQ